MLLKIESNHNLPFMQRSKLTLLVSCSKYQKDKTEMDIIPFLHLDKHIDSLPLQTKSFEVKCRFGKSEIV